MKARVKWVENALHLGETGSGHAVVIDGAREAGGRNLGARPMELVLLGLGGCTAFDVMTILRKSRQRVADCVVELSAERAETPPRVFTRIHMRYVVTGHGLSETKVRRAIDLSAEKYCSASAMLGRTAEITHELALVDADEATAR